MKKIKDWKFDSMWIYISIFIYGLVRIVEYSTGQKGTPEWVIDFFPYILPLVFFLFDNILNLENKK